MPYSYEEQKQHLFTDEGQRLFLKVRDHTKKLLEIAGAVRMQNIIGTVTGDSWEIIACVDRQVELGEIREIQQVKCAGQHRIFTSHF